MTLFSGCAARRPLMDTSISRSFEGAISNSSLAVHPPGLPNVRAWGNIKNDVFQKSMMDSFDQENQSGEFSKEINVLALSGGGDDGAYGAGFLCGLHVQKKLPRFKLVTGISTGALIAPYAFIGDHECIQILSNSYTAVTPQSIFRFKSLFKMFRTDSVADTRPLKKLLDKYVTERMVQKIAKEHLKGRRLYIQTTSLDAQRPVIWDIGAIATNAVGKSELSHTNMEYTVNLIKEIMLASASIPVFFPPVYIPMQFYTNGSSSKPYQFMFPEMHVDGGVASQVFVTGGVLDLKEIKERIEKDGRTLNVYVIRNGKLGPDPRIVEPSLVKIATRSSTTITKYDAAADIFRISTIVKTLGGNFYLQFIPESFSTKSKRMFDNKYMRSLFEFGFQQAHHEKPWMNNLPEQFHYGLWSEDAKLGK
ncbi:MAG: patatin-like phospholipase family protein [Verrucomicrobiae bacterium]|nr:patatin-like phospholipase family protein [Verrucomicrobiae bacterium]